VQQMSDALTSSIDLRIENITVFSQFIVLGVKAITTSSMVHGNLKSSYCNSLIPN